MKARAGVWLAVLAVLVANAAALSHVFLNRSGAEPEVVLTERELPRGFQDKDDTGVSLRFRWASMPGRNVTEDWLNRTKLAELGFDVSADPKNDAAQPRYYSTPPRPAFVALEYDGPAWQKYFSDYAAEMRRSRAQSVEELIERTRTGESRLVPIDAATNAAVLRARYPDATRVLIVGATVRANHSFVGGATSGNLTGWLAPAIAEIHVPLPLSRQFDGIAASNVYGEISQPRYQVHLRFGANHEPWITGVTKLR